MAVVDAKRGILPRILRNGVLYDFAQSAHIVPATMKISCLSEMDGLAAVAVRLYYLSHAAHRRDGVAVVEVAGVRVEAEFVRHLFQP